MLFKIKNCVPFQKFTKKLRSLILSIIDHVDYQTKKRVQIMWVMGFMYGPQSQYL